MLASRYWSTIVAGAFLGACLGCNEEGAGSKPTAHLAGSVLIGGEPIPSDADGTIVFQPSGGGGQAHPASADIKGGRYECTSVPVGDVTAYFNIGRFTGRMIREDGGTPFPEREQLAPEEAQQGIKIQVATDGERDFDL